MRLIYKEETTTAIAEENIDPYARVRFGKTEDTLLLDIEWHTYETFAVR